MSRSRCSALVCLAGLAALAPTGAGGSLSAPGVAVAMEQPRAAQRSLEEIVADAVESVALLDLRMRPAPGPQDYRAADTLLSFAAELDPGDIEIVRRRLEASFLCANLDGVLERTREIVRMDPSDSVAVLRLITMQVARLQTVEERLSAYDRFLGKEGERLDPAIRSRLALDAALLARESGDEQGFVSRLTLSTQLDATNKEAAALAATYFATRRPYDRLGNLEMAINLLLADPMDPNVHFGLAAEFAKNGAFVEAERFHANGRRILAKDVSTDTPEATNIERIILRWHIEGPEAAHAEMERELAALRYSQGIMIKGMEKTGVPTTDALKPEDVRLGLQTERLRMLAADAMGDRTAVAVSIGDYAFSVERLVAFLQDRTRRPANMTDEAAIEQIISMAMERLVIHCWTGVGVDDVLTQLIGSPLITGATADPVAMAWISLHRESPQAAVQRFRDLLGRHTLARVGLGLALEKAGDRQGAIEQYRVVATEYPLSVAAAWARSRVRNMGEPDVSIGATTIEARRMAAAIPSWVERFIEDPSLFMSLSATLDARTLEAHEPASITILLRNSAPIPLALGANRPLNSRFLISPTLDFGMKGDRTLTPEVLDADRRLRLNPHETLTLRVWGDPGFTGLFEQVMASASSRGRFRVLQGFQVTHGVISPGPMCLSAETEQFVRTPVPGAGETPEQIAARIAQCPVDQLPSCLALVRLTALGSAVQPQAPASVSGLDGPVPAPTVTGPDLSPIADALLTRYQDAPDVEKALILAMTPHARLAPGFDAFDRAVRAGLASESSPLVQALILATRVSDPADAALGLNASDDRVAALSAIIQARLSAGGGARCYATASSLDQLMTSPIQEGLPDGIVPQARP